MIVAPTEDDVFTAIRAFLQDVLPVQSSGPTVLHVVVVGQENRVSEPVNPGTPVNSNYVVMWPLRMPQLSTTVEKMIALGLQATYEQSSQCTIQLDVHGPEAFNNSSVITTMFQSSYAVDFFAALGATIAPLYADHPRNMPFNSGEQQYEDRYIIEANLQVNQKITITAQSARALDLDLTNVDTDPASWPNSTVSVVAT
jgi:hypothetical protein